MPPRVISTMDQSIQEEDQSVKDVKVALLDLSKHLLARLPATSYNSWETNKRRWQFLFCIRIENFEGAHTGQTFIELSNGRKKVRMAPILRIFGPNESQRYRLNFAKFSRCRKSVREDENFKKLSQKVRKSLPRVRFRAKIKIETAICQRSKWVHL